MKRLTLKMSNKREFALESQGEERTESLSLKGNVAKTVLLRKDLGFKEKKKKRRECEGERHISPFLSKVTRQLRT